MKIPSAFKLRDWGSDDAPTVPVADGMASWNSWNTRGLRKLLEDRAF
jgi:hypothetical protein